MVGLGLIRRQLSAVLILANELAMLGCPDLVTAKWTVHWLERGALMNLTLQVNFK